MEEHTPVPIKERTVISQKELAARWGCTVGAIINYEHEGKLHRCDIPGVRYSLAEVEYRESVADLPKLSPQERKRMKDRLAEQEEKIQQLAGIVQELERLLCLAKAELVGVKV